MAVEAGTHSPLPPDLARIKRKLAKAMPHATAANEAALAEDQRVRDTAGPPPRWFIRQGWRHRAGCAACWFAATSGRRDRAGPGPASAPARAATPLQTTK